MYQPILFTNCTIAEHGDIWLHALMEEIDPDNLDLVPDFSPRPAKALIKRDKFPAGFDPRLQPLDEIYRVINEDFLFAGCQWHKADEEITEKPKRRWLRIN